MYELFSVGSLGKSGAHETVEEVYVYDCGFTGTQNAARIKTVSVSYKNMDGKWIFYTDVNNMKNINFNFFNNLLIFKN